MDGPKESELLSLKMVGREEGDLRDFVGYELRDGRRVAVFTKSPSRSDDFAFDRGDLEERLRNLQARCLPHELTARVLSEWPAI
jgi:hypothetical protein